MYCFKYLNLQPQFFKKKQPRKCGADVNFPFVWPAIALVNGNRMKFLVCFSSTVRQRCNSLSWFPSGYSGKQKK